MCEIVWKILLSGLQAGQAPSTQSFLQPSAHIIRGFAKT
jgi:hypothetical protein